MNNGYRNTQIRHFRNSKAPNIVRQVFRCCTYETVSFRTLSRLLYFILLDSSVTLHAYACTYILVSIVMLVMVSIATKSSQINISCCHIIIAHLGHIFADIHKTDKRQLSSAGCLYTRKQAEEWECERIAQVKQNIMPFISKTEMNKNAIIMH